MPSPRAVRVALATVPVALGVAVLAPGAAQATSATYHCQSVVLDAGGAIKPLYAYGCTGPASWSAAGTVHEVPTGTLYHCQVLEPQSYPDGQSVFGVMCEQV